MYELEDTEAEAALAADAARGVDVRVILNSAYTRSDNDAAFAYLQARGVHVRWASTRYALTHQKTLVIDTSVSVVMTLNWTSRYYYDTRDVAVIDRSPADIAAIVATFDADYDGAPITPSPGTDLVWSPTTSLSGLLGVIDGATRSLYVENEEMDNSDITDALVAAARRGVNVEICMTNSSSWDSGFPRAHGCRSPSPRVLTRRFAVHPRQGARSRSGFERPGGLRRLAELLHGVAALQPRAGGRDPQQRADRAARSR